MKHYRVEFIVGTSRAKRPTVQLKSFAPFFWVGGGSCMCLVYVLGLSGGETWFRGRLKKFPNFENPLDLSLEFIGISRAEWRIECPPGQLEG